MEATRARADTRTVQRPGGEGPRNLERFSDAFASTMLTPGPMQPPLLPSSQSPERLRFMEKAESPEMEMRTRRPEKNQWLWFLVVLAAFGLVIAAALLVAWLLGL